MIEAGDDIPAVQELLSYSDVKATMVGTYVSNRGSYGIRNPVDFATPDTGYHAHVSRNIGE